MKKTVKAIVLPLVTEGSYQNEMLQEVLSLLLEAPCYDAELDYMAKRAKVMDVELDEFDLI